MKSKEFLMLQDVWRKAWAKPYGLNITFKSHSGAVRARMQLYNAVKSVKSRKDEFADQALKDAADGLEIVWKDEFTIRLQKRAESDMMQGIMEALGTTPEQYMDPEAKASEEKMLEELSRLGITFAPEPAKPAEQESDLKHQDNPFYGKRGG
jgi:hypothetical protein